MANFRLRKATRSDARFLGDMLVEARNWAPSRSVVRVDAIADPEVARYIEGWKRPGDAGTVAVDGAGSPIGACWYRIFPEHSPGSGFLERGVPELTLGVVSVWRAQGVGRQLLHAVLVQARQQGHNRLSLHVDRANFASRLYLAEGFVPVIRRETSLVMVRTLR
ncbi:GNAT family N-acetyltransferase [Mycetocola zhujimingii]|uniref:N-acetyltransferase n=1 Tax=Mycetocola zhujimingii TaxID=2079792 RepID=A0A2U1TE05_9MICO|nr:GNAT family N-acetyltransferase [Mycetocola zhujimingii]AWB86028.1 N-acetyltransferase [Mycetocola zhujimingii]PWC07127.1 N-acetyltransferase [Mycetocola zhujimingii]